MDTLRTHTDTRADYLPWSHQLPVPQGTDILINAHPGEDASPHQQELLDLDYTTVKPRHPGRRRGA